jgi:hypothetical protein
MNSMEQKTERILYRYGDRELWFAEPGDKSWMLPLFLEWRHDKDLNQHFAHVLPALCFYSTQLMAMNAMLQVYDIQGERAQWIIPRAVAEAVLRKASGITVQRYYKWPGVEDFPPIEKSASEIRVEMQEYGARKPGHDAFVRWLCKERKLPASIVNVVMTAISQEAPEWLLKHRKPIDLGFCRIAALPFRPNWKEIVVFKCRNLKLRSLLHLPEDQCIKALEEIDMPAILTSPHNVGLRRGWKGEEDIARIDYTLEIVATEKFEAAANRVEGQRMARGSAAYLTEFEDAVEALYRTIVIALRSYVSKVYAPFAEVSQRRGSCIFGFVPILGRKIKVHDTALSRIPVHIVPPDSGFSVFGKSHDPRLIQASPPPLPEMPALPSPADDVRECPGDGRLEISNGDSGANGLPVCDAAEGEASREPVLAESEDSGDGMAEFTPLI